MREGSLHSATGALVLLLVIGCGGDSPLPVEPGPTGASLTIARIDDRAVIRNTLTPRSVEVELRIDGSSESYSVSVTPDDESVLSSATLTCGRDPCLLTLTPSPDRTARVTVRVHATDGRGGQGETSFGLDVVPRLVTTVEDTGPGSLRDALEAAEAGDVVGFDTENAFATATQITLRAPLHVTKDLTIEGPGADRLALSGGHTQRVLHVDAGPTVLIADIAIRDGFSQAPGAGLRNDGATVVLRDCIIASSAVAVSGSDLAGGGGIANYGSLTLTGCEVRGNEADVGAAALVGEAGPGESPAEGGPSGVGSANLLSGGVAGGGIFNAADATLILRASTVGDNRARGIVSQGGGLHNQGTLFLEEGSAVLANEAVEGGGIFNVGTLTLRSGSRVAGNSAGSVGGGIYNVGGILSVDASTVGGENSAGANAARRGGGIANLNGRVTITAGSRIVGNRAEASGSAETNGGGIYSIGNNASLTIRNGVIAKNAASGTGGRGGAVYNTGVLEIRERSSLFANVAGSSGGGIFNAGQSTIDDSTIGVSSPEVANAALAGGGIFNSGKLEIVNGAHILANSAEVQGCGIFNEGEVVIIASSVTHNTAKDGGGIWNRGLLGIQRGAQGFSHVDLNTAERDGGGIYSGGTDPDLAFSDISIDASSVVSNEANGNGGGLYVAVGTVTVTGTSCLIVANVADADSDGDGRGGGIYNAGGDISGVPANRVCSNRPDDFAP